VNRTDHSTAFVAKDRGLVPRPHRRPDSRSSPHRLPHAERLASRNHRGPYFHCPASPDTGATTGFGQFWVMRVGNRGKDGTVGNVESASCRFQRPVKGSTPTSCRKE
jgi:hypothetical protein